MKRIPAALALLVLATVAWPGEVAAHALLKASDPAKGATLGSAPTSITLTFTETPDPRLSSVKVLDSAGTNHTTGALTTVAGDELSLSVPLDALPDGGYTVSWRAVSAVDGHISAGSFVFGVGQPPPSAGPEQPETPANLSGSPPAIGARWLLYLGLMVLFGAAWVAVAVARRPQPSLLGMAAVGWLLTAVGTVAVVGVQWAEAGAPIETLLTTSLGVAAFARGISLLVLGGAVTALAIVPALAGTRGWAVVALASAAAFVVDVALGHAAAGPTWPVQVAAQAAHAIAAAAWVGGLGALLAILRSTPPDARLALARRFSSWATVMLAVVAVTGAVRALAEIGTVEALVGTDFGRTVLGKTALLLVLAALGAFNHWVTLRNAQRVVRWLGRVGAAEVGLAIVIVVLSAMLVNQQPPAIAGGVAAPTPTPVAQPLIVSGHDFGTSVKARLVVTTGAPGTNTFDLALADYDTGAPVDASAVELRFQVASVTGVAPATLNLAQTAAGRYAASGDELSLDGIWNVTATITLPGGAVQVPLIVPTVVPVQSVDQLVTEGLPTIYVIDVGAAGSAQIYLDPGEGSDPDQLHVTMFDTAGNERPVDDFTVAAFTSDGAGQLLALRLLEPGHVVASIDAAPGPLVVDVVTGTKTGTTSSHLHLHVTIQVQPEVQPS
ncbi:MAG TPA: copper resistance protein CopC [Candidatus Limnocylindrales bacterium]|nr:copper resistance protein CopC [Candidatus Limnocylindrales bacterium]